MHASRRAAALVGGAALALLAVGVVAVAAAQGALAYSTTFTDVAASAGTTNPNGLGDPLNPPPPPPLTPNVTWPQYVALMHMWGGAAVSDYDRDGDPDVFVTNGDAGPSALFRNDGNLTFTDVAAAAGVAVTGRSMGAAWGDFDNDGCRDLFVASFTGPSSLFRNNCNGTFTNVTLAANISLNQHAAGVAWGDYDRDGFLDLVVSCYVVCPNVLLHNRGDGTFEDRTAQAGVGDTGWTFQPMFLDYDQDGDLDLWDINDFGADHLYRNNDDGTFTDVTLQLGVDREGAGGMGGAVGDIDNDGWMDAFVTNYYNDSLYRNTGGGFVETFSGSPVHDYLVGWGTDFFDAENDGDVDLYIGNGFIFEQTHSRFQDDKFMENVGGGVFRNATSALGGPYGGVTHGVATADFDNDGDPDVFAVSLSGPSMLFRNDGVKGNWLKVDLQGTVSNRDAVGALVTVRAGALTVTRLLQAGSSYLSQDDHTLHFGLGAATVADSVTIEWPSGAHEVLTNVSVNQTLAVVEPTALIARAGPDPVARPGVAQTFNASLSSDALDGAFPTGANYTWTIDLGGTTATLFGASPSYTFAASGAYKVTLRVQDGLGNTDTDALVVYVRDEQPPSAAAGADQAVCDSAVVHLDGGNTTDNDPTFGIFGNYTWSVPLPSGTLTLFGRKPTFVPAVPGTYTITLTARDPAGNAATDTLGLTVQDCTPPALALPATVYATEGDEVVVAAVATDASLDFGTAAVYAWTFDNGSGPASSGGALLRARFPLPGVFAASVAVTDGAGNRAFGSTTVVVADVTAPTVDLPGSIAGDEGAVVRIDGSGVHDNDPTFPASGTFTWSVALPGSGGSGAVLALYGQSPSFTSDIPGVATADLTVTDRAGNTAHGRTLIHIADRTAPTVHAGASRDVAAGATVALEGTATDNDPSFGTDSSNATFAWSFEYAGRRVELEGPRQSFRFDEPGVYIVTLTVTDAAGNAASDRIDVRVVAASADPLEAAQRLAAAVAIGAAVAAAVPTWRRAARAKGDEAEEGPA